MRARRLAAAVSICLLMLPAVIAADEGGRAVPFTLPDLEGKLVRLEDRIEQGPVLLTFWASWCTSCKQELHDLLPAFRRFESHGFGVLAINVDKAENLGAVQAYVRSAELPYRFLHDADSSVFARYQPSLVTPFTVLIDGRGRVVYRHEGHVSGDERAVEDLLRQSLEPPEPTGGTGEAASTRETGADDEEFSYGGRWEFSGAYRKPMLPASEASQFQPDWENEWLLDFRSRLYLHGGYGRFLAHGEVNLRGYYHLDEEPEDGPYNRVALEKVAAEYRGETLQVIAGDFRGVWARGLALSLKRLDQDGLDTTIRGGDVVLALPTGTRLEVIGGKINALPYAGIEDREIVLWDGLVFGARAQQGLLEHARIGAFAVVTHFDAVEPPAEAGGAPPDNREPNRFLLAGGEAELLPRNGWVSLYAAGAYLVRDRTAQDELVAEADRPEDPENGHGLYGELKAFLGPVTAFGEIKWYDNFLVLDPVNPELDAIKLIEPPTLEPLGAEFEQNRDLWGFKAGLRSRLFHGAQLAAWMNRTAEGQFGPGVRRDPQHFDFKPVSYQAWLELDYHGHSGFILRHFRLAGGFRQESMLDDAPGPTFNKRYVDLWLAGGELEFAVSLGGPHELRGRTTIKALEEQHGYKASARGASEITQELSYTYESWISVGAIYGFSDRHVARRSKGDDYSHFAGTAALKLDDGWEFRALGGTMFGGKRCVGGVCRFMPDFTGGKLEVVKRF